MLRHLTTWGLSAVSLSGCVGDLGNLEDLDVPPSAPLPTFVVPPRDAGNGAPEPEPAPAPTVPAPLQPTPASLEPIGRGNFTLLHGVVDAETVAFCALLVGPDEVRLAMRPLPPLGLGFGQAVIVPMSDAIDPETTEVRLFVVAAGPERLDSSCAELLEAGGHGVASAVPVDLEFLTRDGAPAPDADAGFTSPFGVSLGRVSRAALDAGGVEMDATLPVSDAAGTLAGDDAAAGTVDSGEGSPDAGTPDAGIRWPDLRVAELPRLLPTTYDDRTYLVTASGCLGAPGFVHDDEAELCGSIFTSNRASLTGLVFQLSRLVDFDAVGLQAAHADLGVSEVTVRSNPGETGGTSFTLVSGLALGSLAPWTAQRTLQVSALGEPLDEVQLEVTAATTSLPDLEHSWSDALRPNTVELVEGRAFTLVLIGASPSLTTSSPFNGALVTIVESDPLR